MGWLGRKGSEHQRAYGVDEQRQPGLDADAVKTSVAPPSFASRAKTRLTAGTT
jgi:hypothetical protein